jgi:hypothetical protein
LPSTGIGALVPNAEDIHDVVRERVEDGVGESLEEYAVEIAVHGLIVCRKLTDMVQDGFELVDEVRSEGF